MGRKINYTKGKRRAPDGIFMPKILRPSDLKAVEAKGRVREQSRELPNERKKAAYENLLEDPDFKKEVVGFFRTKAKKSN